MQENVKKCKNFLATLIKLASHNSPSPETSKNVKSLVQDLLVSFLFLFVYIQIESQCFFNRDLSLLLQSVSPSGRFGVLL